MTVPFLPFARTSTPTLGRDVRTKMEIVARPSVHLPDHELG